MGHFARVYNGVVQEVQRGETGEEAILPTEAPGDWIQTSYNTHGGVHRLGGTPLRKNFAGVGYTYDAVRDAFIPPKPSAFPSWVLNEETCLWEAPVAYPNDGNTYRWDEATQTWIHVVWNDTTQSWDIA